MTEVTNHLWQSTLFAVLVAASAFALRSNRAEIRYWLWLTASLKFLIPFSLLVTVGSRVELPADTPAMLALTVEQISSSFAPVPPVPTSQPQMSTPWWPKALAMVWLFGAIILLARWFRQWLAIRTALKGASRLPLPAPIPVLSSSCRIEPGVFGILRPVLLMPEGITNNLSAGELGAILDHEMAHVERRDNLTAALHMVVQAAFWFHPLVWWIGAKLVEERERACDESVLERGSQPDVYAHGILNVCKFYVESPLPCASGVTGSDLKKRIREIMTHRVSLRLTFAHKAMICSAALAAVAVPLAIGILRAQSLPPPPQYTYEVVSIRPSAPGNPNSSLGPGPQGGVRVQNNTVMQLMTFAYDVRDYQFSGAPGWVKSDRFDLTMTPDKPEITPNPGMARAQVEGVFNRHRQRMQAVLRDRLGLVLRAETKALPVYALTVAKGGHKLAPPTERGFGMRTGRDRIAASGASIKQLTDSLSSLLGRPVINETGLEGPFDFNLQWTPDAQLATPGENAGASIFAAIQEQLGLKLESKKGPVSVFVVEKIEKPSEN
jgi:bla regulator protein blaR1